MLVYRGAGTSVWEQIANSEKIKDLGYASTSLSEKQVKENFDGVQMRIYVKQGAKVAVIALLHRKGENQEYEMLLPRNSIFTKITQWEDENGKHVDLLYEGTEPEKSVKTKKKKTKPAPRFVWEEDDLIYYPAK